MARARSRRPITNVVEAASSFVGRASDVAAIDVRLEEGRLVTILGPGGMGKTRLALRFASERAPAYAAHGGGGVWFCDLSAARGASDVVASVAATLGVTLAGVDTESAIADRVGHAIAALGRVLIVLDNFEQVAGTAQSDVGQWLRLARSARFLVTSRVPLDLAGEQLWPLAPLSRDEAIDLFVRRARDVRPALDPACELEVVGEIVDRIDRMPLAIELAATRTAILSLPQLRDRLARPLDLLQGPREVPRHASLRRVVLDSLEALGPGPRALFVAIAALRNGFTLDAAEAVFGDLVVARADVLDGLSTLARSSLLRVTVEAGDVARYAFFETLRDVAEELLAARGPSSAADTRHAGYYASLCAAARAHVRVDTLAADLENVLAAQQVALALARTGDPSGACALLDIATGLEPLLSARGLARLRVRLFDEALETIPTAGSDAHARAEAHLARGFALRELGEASRAREDFERGLTLAREASDVGLAAVALMRLGGIDDLAGDTPAARARMHEALRLLAETPRGAQRELREAELHLKLGHAYRREGQLALAREAILEAVDRHRALSHDEGLASAMYELGVIEMFAARTDEAFARFDEGLAVAERGGVRLMTGALKTARGCLLQDLGRLAEALEHHAEAARIFEELGSRYREGSALYYLATTFLERGDAAEALGLLTRAEERVADVGAPRYEALIASCRATTLAVLERLEAAEASMARAERAAERVENEPALAATLQIHRLVLAVRRGDGDPSAHAAAAGSIARAHPSDDSRFAERTLRAMVRSVPRSAPEIDALVVRAGGAGFSLPGSRAFVTVPVRSPLRRILEELARRRVSPTGEVLTIDDVIRVGWPSEKMRVEAGLNRAYVALASLRKLGLRGVLLSTGGGYALSRAVVVHLEEEARGD